jgi:hypothetical protein
MADQNKTETGLVTHTDGFSVYDETLALEFTMYYDTIKNCFLDKNVRWRFHADGVRRGYMHGR